MNRDEFFKSFNDYDFKTEKYTLPDGKEVTLTELSAGQVDYWEEQRKSGIGVYKLAAITIAMSIPFLLDTDPDSDDVSKLLKLPREDIENMNDIILKLTRSSGTLEDKKKE